MRHFWSPPAVVVAVPRPAFGLLNQQFIQQTSHRLVDKLAAVIGVKAAADAEGKLPEHGDQHRLQPGFADACGGGHDLPLRDLIDGIDVVDAFGPRLIALMHGVDAQIARLALRIGRPPFSDGRGGGPGLDVVEKAFAIARLLAQVVQVRHRDRGQPLILPLAVLPILAL